MDEQKVSALEQKVKEAIEAIRPSLQNDGGDIEFIKNGWQKRTGSPDRGLRRLSNERNDLEEWC
jgi:hypothetical protein